MTDYETLPRNPIEHKQLVKWSLCPHPGQEDENEGTGDFYRGYTVLITVWVMLMELDNWDGCYRVILPV